MNLEESFEKKDWAVVFTSAGKYIGCIEEPDEELPNAVFISHVQELCDANVPRQAHTPDGPRIVFDRYITARSVSNCLDIESTYLTIQAIGILRFNHMSPGDREWHKNLVRGGIKAAIAQRMQASGLVTPDDIRTGHA